MQRIAWGMAAGGVLVLLALAFTTTPMRNHACGYPGDTHWPRFAVYGARADNPDPTTGIGEGNEPATRYDAATNQSLVTVSCDGPGRAGCCSQEFHLRVQGDQRDIGWQEPFVFMTTTTAGAVLVDDPAWNVTYTKTGLMTTNTYRVIPTWVLVGIIGLAFALPGSALPLAYGRPSHAVIAVAAAFLGVIAAGAGLTMALFVWAGGIVWMPLLALACIIAAAKARAP